MMRDVLIVLCLLCVLLGMVPTLATFAQFLIVGLHGIWNHYPKCADHTPRVAFVLPAWNEADVLGASIDSLMSIDYPAGAWRIYVVDDASTDHTPEVMRAKMAQYPGSVFHLRRDKGGQGKAHTLNHGIRTILAEDWAEAVMIMDADVLFEPLTLRRMVRHLADPEVGGVTAYVKEGSTAGQPAVALHRLRVHHRAGRGAAGAERDGRRSPAWRRRAAAQPREPAWRSAARSTPARWPRTPTRPSRRSSAAGAPVRRQRHRLGRGTRQRDGPVEAAPALGARQPADHGGLPRPVVQAAAGIALFGNVAVRRAVVQHRPDAAVHDPGLGRPGRSLSPVAAVGGAGLRRPLERHLRQLPLPRRCSPSRSIPTPAGKCWFEGIDLSGPALARRHDASRSRAEAFIGSTDLASPGRWSWRDIGRSLVILGWSAHLDPGRWGVYRIDKAGAPKWLRNSLLVLVGYGPLLCAISWAAIIAQLRKRRSEMGQDDQVGQGETADMTP